MSDAQDSLTDWLCRISKVNVLSPVFVCKGCLFSFREAPASSSEGEEKKPGKSASAAENMPEMSADSKLFFDTVIY